MNKHSYREYQDFLDLQKFNFPLAHFETLEIISHQNEIYPIEAIIIGPRDKKIPTLGLFGGVHGLERIGSQIIISFLHSLLTQLTWDQDLQETLENYRLVSIPIVNPVGVAKFTRCNPNHVDLMRNAPIEATGKTSPLVSGHRLSPILPWYRGTEGVFEKEAETLINFVKKEMFTSDISLALDVHSGFGLKDQIWYPYAKSQDEFPRKKEVLALKNLLDKTYPHHIYKIESQSDNYVTHGDLWDYLFEQHQNEFNQDKNLFLPLTLELGSWNWIKKNPLQFFSKIGLFHPLKQHRHARIMRRHLMLLNFLMRATRNYQNWVGLPPTKI